MSFRLNRENMQGVKRSRLRLSAVGLAIWLGAVVAQAQTPAKDVQPAASAAEPAVVPAELQLLVRQALERHPDVLMSEAQSQAAYSQAKEARSQLGPAISVGSSVADRKSVV